ncbi:MAG: alpha/beta fold hydrolase [Chromatiales bacterium]|nr:MAG: alpha/beta fold hydrolase [Chromatiales bacterium]
MEHYRVNGVHVQHAGPPASESRPPLIFVHGGLHGSWSWHRFLPVFSHAGWECHALDWYGHHESDALPAGEFLTRSIADVGSEIGLVAAHVGRVPVLVGHSMGALACLKYAEAAPVAALVLLAPVLPEEIGNPDLPLDVDPNRPWEPPPFELARKMFFDGVEESDARQYYELLCAESPRCVAEATGKAAVPVELDALNMPTLILVGEEDRLTPADLVQELAGRLDADFRRYATRSHSLLVDKDAEQTAELIAGWLTTRLHG